MSKTSSYIGLFKELGTCDPKTGISEFVYVDDFKDKFSCLKLGNGGSWCRFDSKFGKQYKIMTISKNKKIRYSWSIIDEEEKKLLTELDDYLKNTDDKKLKGRSIYLIKLCGFQNKNNNKPISKKTRNFYKNKPCVVCGSNNDLIIDHKNGLYNDERVLNSKTQTIEDFQVLCNHCNLQKRQTMIWTKQNKKRYPASKIPQLKIFNIDFTVGDEKYNSDDKNAMEGTFWYDPIDFMEKIILKFKEL